MTTPRIVLAAAFASLLALPAAAKVVEDVVVPATLAADGATLKLNGAGLRKAFFMSFYVAALYVEQPAGSATALLGADKARVMHITMVRDVTRSMFAKAVREGVEKNAGDAMPRVMPQVEQLLAPVTDMKKGDVLLLTYTPGKGTRISGTGLKGDVVIAGKELADVILSVWIGEHPVQADLKKALLSSR